MYLKSYLHIFYENTKHEVFKESLFYKRDYLQSVKIECPRFVRENTTVVVMVLDPRILLEIVKSLRNASQSKVYCIKILYFQ